MGHWHAHALKRSGGRLVAVADFDHGIARKLTAKYPDSQSFKTIDEMLLAAEIDVAHICSPTRTHEKIAKTAIKAGKHLLIEKPLAATFEATASLFDMARKYGAILCPAHQFPFQTGSIKAKNRINEIGRVINIEAQICSAGGVGLDEHELTVVAADILPHPLSMIQEFTVSGLDSFEWNILTPTPGELRITATDSGGLSASISISMNSRPTTNSFRVFGTRGTFHLDLFHGFSFIEPGGTSRFRKVLHPFDLGIRQFFSAAGNLVGRTMGREPAYPGLRRLIHEFYGAIKDSGPMPITPEAAVAIARTRDLLLKKAGIQT